MKTSMTIKNTVEGFTLSNEPDDYDQVRIGNTLATWYCNGARVHQEVLAVSGKDLTVSDLRSMLSDLNKIIRLMKD